MCGFGSLATVPFKVSPLAQTQFTFSKKATALQGTSIRTYYNQRRSEITNQPASPSTIPNDHQQTSQTPQTSISCHYPDIVDSMTAWLHRRGPDITNIIHLDNIHTHSSAFPVQQRNPNDEIHQLSIVSSVLHLRGIDGEPISQPMYTSQIPPSITSQLIPPLPSYYIPRDSTFSDRFPKNNPPKASVIHFPNASSMQSSLQSLPYISYSSHDVQAPEQTPTNTHSHPNADTQQLFFSWNGEVFAGDVVVEVGQSDTQLLFESFLASISSALAQHQQLDTRDSTQNVTTPPPSTPNITAFTSAEQYSHLITLAVHDVLNQIQGPFAMMLVHRSTPVPILCPTRGISYQTITTAVICRDKVGRRSLLLRLLGQQQSVEKIEDAQNPDALASAIEVDAAPSPTDHKRGDETPQYSGFIVSSQAFHVGTSIRDESQSTSHSTSQSHHSLPFPLSPFEQIPQTHSQFTFHNPDWFEIPCSGLFSISFSTQTQVPTVPTLQFLPWNHSTLDNFQNNNPCVQKIPESLLFPALHPSLTPLPNPTTFFPPKLQQFFISIVKLTKTPLPSQLFFLRLAEAVRRQVHQLPKLTRPTTQSNSNLPSNHSHQTQNNPHNTSLPSPTPTPTPLNFSTEPSQITSNPARIAVLFSGGIDCTMVAALTHFFLPIDEPIDLINVAFSGTKSSQTIDATAPDRIASMDSLLQLINIAPERHWRLIKVNITKDDLLNHTSIISSLIAPHNTTMDCNIGSVLYFGARGLGVVHVPTQQQVTQISESANGIYTVASDNTETEKRNSAPLQMNDTSHKNAKNKSNNHNPPTTVRYADFSTHPTSIPSTSNSPAVSTPITPQQAQRVKLQQQKELESKYELVDISTDFFNFFPLRTPGLKLTQKMINGVLPKPCLIKMKKLLGEEAKFKANLTRLKESLQLIPSQSNSSKDQSSTEQQQRDVVIISENDLNDEQKQQLHDLTTAFDTFQLKNSQALYVSRVFCEGLPINAEHCPEVVQDDEDSNSTANTAKQTNGGCGSPSSTVPPSEIRYTSHARVLLLGSGADEQLGGYGRHRTGYRNALRHLMHLSLNPQDTVDIAAREEELYGQKNVGNGNGKTDLGKADLNADIKGRDLGANGDDDEDDIGAGWLDLIQLEHCQIVQEMHKFQSTTPQTVPTSLNELTPLQKQLLQEYALHIDLKKDTLRIWLRNLGRDDRVLAYWGKESRIPFLDEDVMRFLTMFRVDNRSNDEMARRDDAQSFSSNHYDASSLSESPSIAMRPYYALEAKLAELYEGTLGRSENANDEMAAYLTRWNDLINTHLVDGQNGNDSALSEPDSDQKMAQKSKVEVLPLSTLCNMLLPQGLGDKLLLRICTNALNIRKTSVLQKRAMQFGSKIANRHITGVVRLNQVNCVLDIVNPQLMD